MEERREAIEGLMRTHGYTEEEAEVAYHLKVAHDRLAALYQRSFGSLSSTYTATRAGVSRIALVDTHFQALYAVLDRWVLERDYPDRMSRPSDEG